MDKDINLKGIIFDKDGTLFDYSAVWHDVIVKSIDKSFENSKNKLKEKRKKDLITLLGLDENGKTNSKGVIFSHGKINITKKGLRYCITNLMRPSTLVKHTKEIQEYNNVFIEEKIKSMDFSKQKNLFLKLKDLGYKIAIVTVDTRISANIFVKHMGLENLVDYISTKDDDFKNKPNPDSFIHFCNKFNLKTTEVAMVGDTLSDMKYGINSKAGYLVGLLWGANDIENLNKHANVVYPNIYSLLNDKYIMKTK